MLGDVLRNTPNYLQMKYSLNDLLQNYLDDKPTARDVRLILIFRKALNLESVNAPYLAYPKPKPTSQGVLDKNLIEKTKSVSMKTLKGTGSGKLDTDENQLKKNLNNNIRP